jgi:enolase
MQMGTEIFHNLKKILSERGLTTSVGDEGGFAPKLDGTEDALNTIILAIEKSGYSAGDQVMIALDCASSEFYVDGMYDYSKFEGKNGKILNSNQQAEYLSDLAKKFPIISIEDGMDENDWDGWEYLTKICGKNIQLVGDDLFVTNVNRLSNGIKNKIGNSILIKVNQIGTLTETIDAVNMAHEAGFTSVMSHRSGETEDYTIADLAVGLSTGQIKTGSASRSDRVSKYNQLLRIEEQLGSNAYFPKKDAFKIAF